MPTDRRVLSANARLGLACLAEAGLAALAAGLAWWLEIPLAELLAPAGRVVTAVVTGLLATLPMVVFLLWMLRSAWLPIARLRRLVRGGVGRMLDGATTPAILAVAVMAGVGEELLFRGALQPLAVRWLEPIAGGHAGWLGVTAVALLFGLAHPMSRMYIVVATVGGLYLGALAFLSGEVLSAVVAHAAYDVVALYWLRPAAGVRGATHEL